MKRKRIITAILIPSLSVLILGIAIMAAVVGSLSSSTANTMTGQLIDARIDEHAKGFLLFSEDVYSTLKTTAPIISNYINPEFALDVSDPRGEVIKVLSEVLLSNDKIYGMWTCWEPNAFDGKDSEYAGASFYDATGRFVPYVYQEGGSLELEALVDYEDPVKGEYYQAALNTGKPYITDPFIYNIDGLETIFCSLAIPIYKNGEVAGVVGADINLKDMTALMDSGSILDDGYIFIISPKGFLTTHPNKDFVMRHYNTGWMKNYGTEMSTVLSNGGSFNIKAYSDVSNIDITFLGSGVKIGDIDRYWLVCGVVPEKTVNASSTALFFTIIAIGFILIIVTGITIFLIVHRHLKKLPQVADAAQKISEGNFDVSIGSNNNNEIADVSNALLNVKETVQRLVCDIKKMSDEFEAGKIESKIDESLYKGEFQTITKEINCTIEGLVEGTLTAIGLVTEFGNGNFDVNIKQYPGQKEILTTSFQAVQTNFKRFNKDINSIIIGATDGNLDITIDVSQYMGDWRKMAGEINGLVSAVVKPIREAIDVLNKLSNGNLDITVNGDYKGEFAAMKSALNNTLAMLASYIKEISTILTALSKNDLDQVVAREYVGEFSAIKTALNTIINKLNRVISEISAAAGQVAAGAKQISESSMTLAQGATEQASSAEELNATVSVINENTVQNAKNAEEAKELSDRSKNHAAKGDQDMNNMLASMDSIKASSSSISKIIKVIDDIAFQTNLLALNAAIEAARAGQHGKGFAVVADEVRNLAGKSKESAKETALLIEESINRVNEGTEIAKQTAEALRTILNEVSSVADIITDIAASSDEQAAAISQVTEGLSMITDVIQDNSATSEEAASASQQLFSQAEVLQDLVSVFNLKKNYK